MNNINMLLADDPVKINQSVDIKKSLSWLERNFHKRLKKEPEIKNRLTND